MSKLLVLVAVLLVAGLALFALNLGPSRERTESPLPASPAEPGSHDLVIVLSDSELTPAPRTPAPETERTPRPVDDVVPPSDAAEKPEVLLAGRVSDRTGTPVPDAIVRVKQRAMETMGTGTWRVELREVPGLVATTGRDGHFEIRGRAEGALQVFAERAGWAPGETVDVTPPRLDLELVLEPAGALELSLAPRSIDLASCVGLVVSRPGSENDVQGKPRAFSGGSVLRDGLVPGSYDVHLVDLRIRRPIFTVDGVLVRAGEVTRDPRLLDIELHVLAKLVHVTLLSLEGRRALGITVFAGTLDVERGQPTNAQGIATFLVDTRGVDLLVREPGFRELRARGVVEDVTLQLRAHLTLTVRRAPPASSPLVVYLWEKSRPVRDARAELGVGATEAVLKLDEPGTYSLRWTLALPNFEGTTLYLHPRAGTSQEVVVGEGGSTAWLAVDGAELERLEAEAATLRTTLVREPGESLEAFQRRAQTVLLERQR